MYDPQQGQMVPQMAGATMAVVLPEIQKVGWGEKYASGSRRLIDEARMSTRAQGYQRGQNTTQRKAIRPQHGVSNNMKCHGYTQAIQTFKYPMGVFLPFETPSGKRSTSQQRVSLPSLNNPSQPAPIISGMPWNR